MIYVMLFVALLCVSPTASFWPRTFLTLIAAMSVLCAIYAWVYQAYILAIPNTFASVVTIRMLVTMPHPFLMEGSPRHDQE